MNRIKFFIDVDNVIINSTKAVCEWFEDKYYWTIRSGLTNTPNWKNVKEWDFQDEMPTMTKEDIEDVFSSNKFFKFAEFFPNVKEVITELINDKRFEVIFCSIGTVKNISNKMKFLEKHFPNATQLMIKNGVIMDKSLVNMSESIFLDDNISNLRSSNSLVKICFTYDNKLDKSWNSGWRGKCVCNWNDLTPDSVEKILYQDGYGGEKYE